MFFTSNNNFYKQKFSSLIASLLTSCSAYLYLEFRESGPFKNILLQNYYFTYINDILIIYPDDTILTDLVNKINSVEPTISFTDETQTNSK